MVKMTFTLDEATVASLKRIARRLRKPQSMVLREAISFYEPHAGQLSSAERRQRVAVFDQLLADIPATPVGAVDDELREVRQSRRKALQRGGRRQSRRS